MTPFDMRQIVIFLCAAGVALCGCAKKDDAQPKSETTSYPASVEPQTSATGVNVVQAAPRNPQSPAAPSMVQNPAVVQAGSDTSAVLAQLTQAVRRYGAEKQKVPASVSEVIGAGYVQGSVQPPPGKKFTIDPKRLEVLLVNQ